MRHWTDDDGSWSQAEAEWDEEQAAWMLALRLYRDTRCPTCSGDLALTTAPENEGKFRAELPTQCFRCAAFELSHDAYADHPQQRSLLHAVPLTPRR